MYGVRQAYIRENEALTTERAIVGSACGIALFYNEYVVVNRILPRLVRGTPLWPTRLWFFGPREGTGHLPYHETETMRHFLTPRLAAWRSNGR